MSPEPEQTVVSGGMGVFPQHRKQAAEAGLKTLADAVQLIAPQRRGIDQQQGTQPKSQANGQRQKQPAAFHRLRSKLITPIFELYFFLYDRANLNNF